MTVIVPLTKFHKEWVQARTQHKWVEDTQGFVAIRGVVPIGAVAMDSFTGWSCNVHMCLDTPMALRSDLLPSVFGAFFNVFGGGLMIAGIPSTNVPMIDLASHIGFRPLGEIPDGVQRGIDRVVMTMNREQCGWLPKEAA